MSWLYAAVVWVRNLLYDEHILPSHKPKIATICVGNLAVGGTGKTPHTEYIIALLMGQGYKVGVLSRGYKRQTKGFVLADDTATAETIGDEPRQMQLRFPGLVVAVSESRVQGLKKLKKVVPDLDIVVLDDAFQHRQVRCGLNILLTPADRLYVHDHFLPYGRLRDMVSSSLRADVIVVTKCPPTLKPIDKRVILNHLHPVVSQQVVFSSVVYPDELPEKAYLLTGIAQPSYLLAHLGGRVVDKLLYDDHHRYTEEDIAFVAERFHGNYPILTTEKDYVKLVDAGLLENDLLRRVIPIRITTSFGEDKELFDTAVTRYARENCTKPAQLRMPQLSIDFK